MAILYDLIFLIAAIFYIPYLTWRRKWHAGILTRLGILPLDMVKTLRTGKNIWIHAVSVGEVLAIVHLVRRMKSKYPHFQIVCSTVTKTGYRIAENELRNMAVVLYAPLDFSWIVRKFIAVIKPKIYIAAETEIWPNLYLALYLKKIPIVQINGRVSDRAFEGYKKIKFLIKKVLRCVQIFCVQTELEAKRLSVLGADKKRIRITGNIKFDNVPQPTSIQIQDLGLNTEEDMLWIAGSTHPGEEEVLIEVFDKLRKDFPHLRLLLAPRHVERAQEVVKMVQAKGLNPLCRSTMKDHWRGDQNILILDVMGQLRNLYQFAKIVFVGKSFFVGGGQNILEPAFFGKPIFIGPHTYNFRDIVRIFLQEGALIQVQNPEELYRQMVNLLKDPLRLERMGSQAKRLVERYQGATQKTFETIEELLF